MTTEYLGYLAYARPCVDSAGPLSWVGSSRAEWELGQRTALGELTEYLEELVKRVTPSNAAVLASLTDPYGLQP